MHDLPADITFRLASRAVGAEPPLAALSDAELARLATFGSPARRNAFALGRDTVRKLLADRLAQPAAEVPLTVASDGALECPAGDLRVSLAHTVRARTTVAVAAAASRALGVDIEALRARQPELYRRILREDEYVLLDHFSDHDRAQVTLWALKEAVLKAQRTGLRTPARAVSLQIDTDRQRGRARVDGGAEWELRFTEWRGCVISMAYRP
jgi:phosphopantetheinyl transferase